MRVGLEVRLILKSVFLRRFEMVFLVKWGVLTVFSEVSITAKIDDLKTI